MSSFVSENKGCLRGVGVGGGGVDGVVDIGGDAMSHYPLTISYLKLSTELFEF